MHPPSRQMFDQDNLVFCARAKIDLLTFDSVACIRSDERRVYDGCTHNEIFIIKIAKVTLLSLYLCTSNIEETYVKQLLCTLIHNLKLLPPFCLPWGMNFWCLTIIVQWTLMMSMSYKTWVSCSIDEQLMFLKKGKKTRVLYAEAFPGDTSSTRPMTGRHATYRRRHDTAEDGPIIINATIKTED